MCWFTVCDFRAVFGALVPSSLDPTPEPHTWERCAQGGGQGTEREEAKQGGGAWWRTDEKLFVWRAKNIKYRRMQTPNSGQLKILEIFENNRKVSVYGAVQLSKYRTSGTGTYKTELKILSG